MQTLSSASQPAAGSNDAPQHVPAKEAVGIVADPCDQTEVHAAAAPLSLTCPNALLAGMGRRFRAG